MAETTPLGELKTVRILRSWRAIHPERGIAWVLEISGAETIAIELDLPTVKVIQQEFAELRRLLEPQGLA